MISILLYEPLTYYMGKKLKSHTKIINLKYQLQHEIKSLNYLMDYILYQIFKITLNISLKKQETVTDNPSIMISVNKIENKVRFKIETGYFLKLLNPETMKLLGSIKSKINKNKNGENVPHLETTEVTLVH